MDLSRRDWAGLLVTIEGPNGAGKSSLVHATIAVLGRNGFAARALRQPSDSRLGRFVREAEDATRGRALACLVAGDRHEQMETVVLPLLRAGEIVVLDRYIESSLVLQVLDGVPSSFV